MQLTSWLLVSFCNIKLLFWRYLRRRMTKLFLAHDTILVRATALLVAQLACAPTVALSKPRASSGFIYRAGSCQAHRPQGWSVNGKEDFTPAAGFCNNHETPVTKSLEFSRCELPAAVLFKELTWHWCNVFDLQRGNTTLDFGLTNFEAWARRGAPGDWAGCWGMGVKRRRQWHRPAVLNTSERRQNETVCLTRGCRVSARAQADSSQLCLRGEDLAINSPAKVGRVGGKRSFDCFMPGSLCFYKMGCWKHNRA